MWLNPQICAQWSFAGGRRLGGNKGLTSIGKAIQLFKSGYFGDLANWSTRFEKIRRRGNIGCWNSWRAGLVNFNWWIKFILLPTFVNKVLLEHCHVYLFIHLLWLPLYYNGKRGNMTCKALSIYFMTFYRNRWPTCPTEGESVRVDFGLDCSLKSKETHEARLFRGLTEVDLGPSFLWGWGVLWIL